MELYGRWLEALYQSYFLSRREEFVQAADEVAKKLLRRDPNHYAGHLQSAIGHFVLRKDIDAAKREIMACRRVRDNAWRYSKGSTDCFSPLWRAFQRIKRAVERYLRLFAGLLAAAGVWRRAYGLGGARPRVVWREAH